MSSPLQAYTWPDTQSHEMSFVDLSASHLLGANWTLSGNLYDRKASTSARSSNVNGDFEPTLAVGPGNQPTGNVIEQIDQYRAVGAPRGAWLGISVRVGR